MRQNMYKSIKNEARKYIMTAKSEQDIIGLTTIGRLVAETLQIMQASVEPGMTTAELDAIAAKKLAEHGARSAPKITLNYPGTACISINDEAAHGLPGSRMIEAGDIVKIDLSAELNGYFGDAALTTIVPPVKPEYARLTSAAKAAFEKGIAAAITGNPINAIGRAIETEARKHGFSVIEELPGHGVGTALHEEPTIPTIHLRRMKQKLHTGLVITVEPHLSMKRTRIYQADDGWTLKTHNRSFVANFEHTVIVMPGRPIILTAV